MPWYDKTQEGNQRRYRDDLIAAGTSPAEASRMAKAMYPLADSRARVKNRQPRGGSEGICRPYISPSEEAQCSSSTGSPVTGPIPGS